MTVWDAYASDPDRWVCGEWGTTDETVEFILKRLPDQGSVLEIGCGVGRLTLPVAQQSRLEVVAVDVSSRMIAQAPQHERITYMRNDGCCLPAGQFAGAWSVLVFQHLDPHEVQQYLFELGRVLNPGAPALIQFVPGNHHAWLDHQHTPGEIEEWAAKAELDVVEYSLGIQAAWIWVELQRRVA